MQQQLFAGPDKHPKLDTRFKSIKSVREQKSYRQPVYQNCSQLIRQELQKSSALSSVVIDGQNFIQVPERLVGSKLERYFTQTSVAVVAMSCCKDRNIQVHRLCLRDM